MGINPLTPGSVSAQAAAASSPNAKGSTGSTSSTSKPKKDTVVVTQKAKDLAAQMAGKSSQEEMSESVAAKMEEGSNS